jgi:DNA repair exonuclease SbcCD ATPase subunit
LDFDEQLESLREEKQQLEEEIEAIEAKLSRKSSNTEELRRDLERLTESLQTGEVPENESASASPVDGIEPVELNPDTERPPRGARSEQIRQAIDVISDRKDEETFRAAELFELLEKADASFGDDQRAYLYSKLDDLREEDVLEKVSRGTWTLAD